MSGRQSLGVLVLSGLSVLFSCQPKSEMVPENKDSNYYPLETGIYRIFLVDEINYSFTQNPDTLHYYLKELVGDVTNQNDTEVSHLVNYFTKSELNDSIPWKLSYTVFVTKDNIRVIEVLDNNPVIKIVFPFQENLRWDANAMSSAPSDQFEMRGVGDAFENQFLNFERTVSIYQSENLDSLISRNYRKEIFAENAGLIFRDYEILEYCQDDDCFGQGIVNEGIKIQQTIVEFGKE